MTTVANLIVEHEGSRAALLAHLLRKGRFEAKELTDADYITKP